jgi:hypothetical protein
MCCGEGSVKSHIATIFDVVLTISMEMQTKNLLDDVHHGFSLEKRKAVVKREDELASAWRDFLASLVIGLVDLDTGKGTYLLSPSREHTLLYNLVPVEIAELQFERNVITVGPELICDRLPSSIDRQSCLGAIKPNHEMQTMCRDPALTLTETTSISDLNNEKRNIFLTPDLNQSKVRSHQGSCRCPQEIQGCNLHQFFLEAPP